MKERNRKCMTHWISSPVHSWAGRQNITRAGSTKDLFYLQDSLSSSLEWNKGRQLNVWHIAWKT